MTGFTDAQVAALGAPLARENVKQREQSGRMLSYIEGWHAIVEANRIFGFDAWDRELIDLKCVSEKARKIGKGQNQKDGHQVCHVARARIIVRAGDVMIRREGVGYGSGIDADLGAAHESAVKEAETDAMKRALVTFGNPFGLALYDKEQAEVAPAVTDQKAARGKRPNGSAVAPPHDPVSGEILGPHAIWIIQGKRRLSAPEWLAQFEAAIATASSQRELDRWRKLNARALDLLHRQAPAEHSAAMAAIAAAAERIRRGGRTREPGEDVDNGYRAAAE